MKSVQRRSFSGLYFSVFGLNIDGHLRNKSPLLINLFSPNMRKYGQEKLRIWIIFTDCVSPRRLINFPRIPLDSTILDTRVLDNLRISSE